MSEDLDLNNWVNEVLPPEPETEDEEADTGEVFCPRCGTVVKEFDHKCNYCTLDREDF